MVDDQEISKNIGQISSGSTMISSKLKASFHTVSAAKPHRIFITAEDNATVNCSRINYRINHRQVLDRNGLGRSEESSCVIFIVKTKTPA